MCSGAAAGWHVQPVCCVSVTRELCTGLPDRSVTVKIRTGFRAPENKRDWIDLTQTARNENFEWQREQMKIRRKTISGTATYCQVFSCRIAFGTLPTNTRRGLPTNHQHGPPQFNQALDNRIVGVISLIED